MTAGLVLTSAPLLEVVLTVGSFLGVLAAVIAAQIWSRRRRRRGEEASTAHGGGIEVILRPPPRR